MADEIVPGIPRNPRSIRTVRAAKDNGQQASRIKLSSQPLPEPSPPLKPKTLRQNAEASSSKLVELCATQPELCTPVDTSIVKKKTSGTKAAPSLVPAPEEAPKAPVGSGTKRTLATLNIAGGKEPAPATKTPRRKRPTAPPPKAGIFLKLSISDKILLFKHLSVMLEAGIPLQEALEVLVEQLSTPSLKSILSVAVNDLSDGYQLSWSLAKYPNVFGPFLTNVMAVGEESGTLSTQLKYLADQLEKQQALNGKVRSALMYPLIVLVGALGIGAYLAFFLLPKLIPMFMSLKIDLPLTTRIMIWVSAKLSAYWMWIAVGLVVAVILGAVLVRLKPVKAVLHSTIVRLPIFGKLARDIQLVQVARVLGTLLARGLHIVPALEVTRVSLSNMTYQDKLQKISKAVERGENLAATLQAYPHLFSKTAVSMVGVGERTGRLSNSLLSLADFAEREVDNATKNLSSLIEPLMLLIVGVLVGFVALSIITPIYQLTQGMSR